MPVVLPSPALALLGSALLGSALLGSATVPLMAQVGPFTAPGTNGTPLPQREVRPPRARNAPAATPAAPAPAAEPGDSARLEDCLAAVDENAEDGAESAEGWLAAAKGHDAAQAGLCLGAARSRQDDWAGAEQAFLAALDLAGSDRLLRARLGAMAGNAALAGGGAERALAALDTARAEAKGLADPAVIAPIALDRARALVALNRLVEAGAALAEARAAAPGDSETWLLSATLARRQGRLAEAQALIERAAELRPVDPAIGLEAGVVAVLSGRPEAARKSWESVIGVAADSPEAATARGYLAQLAPPAGAAAPARPVAPAKSAVAAQPARPGEAAPGR